MSVSKGSGTDTVEKKTTKKRIEKRKGSMNYEKNRKHKGNNKQRFTNCW